MENSIYIGLSRQVALQRQLSLVANNVANANTPGYRADKMLFEEYLTKPKPVNESMSFVLDYGQYKDEEAGPTSYTGNPLDVALDGPGFFMVETAAGTQYTRAGNFGMNTERELVTPSGNRVLDPGGNPILIPKDATDIRIAKTGEVSTENGVVGKLGVMEFANVQRLRPTGAGYYVNDGLPGVEAETTVTMQGMLEGSNVKPVMEMTDLIEISRQYQSMQNLLQSEHELQRNAIKQLTE